MALTTKFKFQKIRKGHDQEIVKLYFAIFMELIKFYNFFIGCYSNRTIEDLWQMFIFPNLSKDTDNWGDINMLSRIQLQQKLNLLITTSNLILLPSPSPQIL